MANWKALPIKSCRQCTQRQVFYVGKDMCTHTKSRTQEEPKGRLIPNVEEIAEFCPLKKYEAEAA